MILFTVLLLFYSVVCATKGMALECIRNCDWTHTEREIKGCIKTCQLVHRAVGNELEQVNGLVQRRYDEMVRDDKIKRGII